MISWQKSDRYAHLTSHTSFPGYVLLAADISSQDDLGARGRRCAAPLPDARSYKLSDHASTAEPWAVVLVGRVWHRVGVTSAPGWDMYMRVQHLTTTAGVQHQNCLVERATYRYRLTVIPLICNQVI